MFNHIETEDQLDPANIDPHMLEAFLQILCVFYILSLYS